MKWIATILALLVLTLSVQPVCAATPVRAQVDACCADDCNEESEDNTTDHEGACKSCNPFLSCACCAAGVVIPQVSFSLRPPVPASPAPMWGQSTASASEASLSDFWQPPRRA